MALGRVFLVLAAGVLVSGCGETVIEVTVSARDTVVTPSSLRVLLTNEGDELVQTFDVTGRELPLTFTVTTDGRSGEVGLTILASDSDGAVVGAASSSANISDGSTSLEMRLDPADFPVNADVDGVQRPAFRQGRNGRAITATATGFAAAFVNDCQVAATCDVFVRRFDFDGKPIETRNSTSEFSINSNDYPVVSVPAIAAAGNGEIAVVWETPVSIHVSQIDADGRAIVSDLQVTVATVEDPVDPAILGRAEDFVMTWYQESDSPDPAGIYQATLSSGVLGATTLARDSGDASAPTLAQATGVNVLTAWAEDESAFVEITPAGGAASEDSVVAFEGERIGALQAVTTSTGFVLSYGRSAGGEARGQTLTELTTGGSFVRDLDIATTSRTPTDRPAIAPTSDGGVAVTWTECDAPGGDGCDILLQLFGADLSVATEPIRVNTTTAGNQFDPAITVLPEGFAIMWADGSRVEPDTSGGIRARIIYSDTL